MQFDLGEATAILARTPRVVRSLLDGLGPEWVEVDEGPETWSAFDVVGHLIHGERTDWIGRARRILDHGESLAFEPFDRFAMLGESRGKTLDELLDTFDRLRDENLVALRALELDEVALERTGRHPDFGQVTLRQLLATWVAHDLGHLAQISRVLAKRYSHDVGPWRAYLPVLGAAD